MAKSKSVYYCQNCGAQSATWLGRCNACGQWNTFVEEVIHKETKNTKQSAANNSKPRLLSEIADSDFARIVSDVAEVDRVMGGGVVPGSVILLGGDPGIGKSTLMLQLAMRLTKVKILYVSGEESASQIKLRAMRMSDRASENFYILNETNIETIFSHIETLKPQMLIVDSIQTLQTSTLESSAGTVSQIRETASQLQQFAKNTGVPVFLIGHITKDGVIAGPKVLEHIVDVVLQFEGDSHYMYRMLRAVKNRFGSTSEIGIFEMTQEGLREIGNPSEMLISHHGEDVSGVAVACTMEGMRPMMLEIQTLVAPAVYGSPQRSATGFDIRRLNMLLAVLDKKCGFKFGSHDVFLNVAGGIKTYDTATDLAVVASLLSSVTDIAVNEKVCFAGEISLSGEIRPVTRMQQRINEAAKLGYKRIFVSDTGAENSKEIKVVKVARIADMLKQLFE
ncbi:MAG: DNA repair protein RadA [Bacteroidales bacterium]|nr:DNA repair protein RadA [Bacteroidales bacterium]